MNHQPTDDFQDLT